MPIFLLRFNKKHVNSQLKPITIDIIKDILVNFLNTKAII